MRSPPSLPPPLPLLPLFSLLLHHYFGNSSPLHRQKFLIDYQCFTISYSKLSQQTIVYKQLTTYFCISQQNKQYMTPTAYNVINNVVKELNADVCPLTFQSTTGNQIADLYTSPNQANELVGHGTCAPVNSTLIETVIINFG